MITTTRQSIWTLFITLMLSTVIAVMGIGSPTQAAPASRAVTPPEKVTIHVTKTINSSGPIDLGGLEDTENKYESASAGYTFGLIKLPDTMTSEEREKLKTLKTAQTYFKEHKEDGGGVEKTTATDNGKTRATFTEVANSGYYLIVELARPDGAPANSWSAPSIVQLPVQNPESNDSYLKNIYLYTKSDHDTGSVEITKKHGHGEDTPVHGATYELFAGTLDKSPITPLATKRQLSSTSIATITTGSDGKASVHDLEPGNYYFKETAAPNGLLLNNTPIPFTIVANSTKAVQVEQTNWPAPTIEKMADSPDGFQIGDPIRWTIKADVPTEISNYSNYEITDTLDNRLAYEGATISMYCPKNGGTTTPLEEETDYTVEKVGNKVTFKFIMGPNTVLGKVSDEDTSQKTLTIKLNSTVKETVDNFDGSFTNSAVINSNNGRGGGDKEDDDTAETWTGGYHFMKTKEDERTGLAGAVFVIYRKTGEGTKEYLVQDSTTKHVRWVASKETATEFTSPDSGKFNVLGLAKGTYFLEETKAPANYKLLETDQEFAITKDSYSATKDNPVKIINKSNDNPFPITGGIGSLIFLIVGSLLMAMAYAIYRRRRPA